MTIQHHWDRRQDGHGALQGFQKRGKPGRSRFGTETCSQLQHCHQHQKGLFDGEVNHVVFRRSVDGRAYGRGTTTVVVVVGLVVDDTAQGDAGADGQVRKPDLQGCQVVGGAAEEGRARGLQTLLRCVVDV